MNIAILLHYSHLYVMILVELYYFHYIYILTYIHIIYITIYMYIYINIYIYIYIYIFIYIYIYLKLLEFIVIPRKIARDVLTGLLSKIEPHLVPYFYYPVVANSDLSCSITKNWTIEEKSLSFLNLMRFKSPCVLPSFTQ